MPISFLSCRRLALASLVLTAAVSVQAADIVFTNANGGNWNAAANWSPNQVPAAGDSVWITNAGSYTVTNTAAATVSVLNLGTTNGTQTLRLTAGALVVTNTIASSNAVIVLNGGALTTAGTFANAGRVDQNSGTWRLMSTAALGTYNFLAGELRGGTLTVTNMNWTDGNMNADANGDKTIIPANGVLNLLGTASRFLSYNAPATSGRGIDNYGTWNWTGNNILYALQKGAVVNNYGSVNIGVAVGNAQFSYYPGYGAPTWNNYGSFAKTNGAGIFYFNGIYLNNSGSLAAQSGTLSLYGSAVNNTGPITIQNATLQAYGSDTTNAAAITLDANSFFTMDSGGVFAFEPSSSLNSPSENHWLVNAGTMYLRTTNIISPSVVIAGGTLWHQTNNTIPTVNESSGVWRLSVVTAINSFNFTNGELRGGTLTVTNLNWINGNMNADANGDKTIIPSGGVLNLLGNATRYLSYNSPATRGRDLNNYGTWNWTGDSLLYGIGAATVNNYGPVTVNGGAGSAQFLYYPGYASPTWNNIGSVTKASGSGVFYFNGIYLNNSGTINAQSGTVSLYGSSVNNTGPINVQNATLQAYGSDTTNAAAITLDANSFFTMDSGGTFVFEPSSSLNSPAINHVKLNAGGFYLRTLNFVTPGLWLNGAVLYQQTNVTFSTLNQSAGTFELRLPCAVANYNLTNGELRGRDLTVTNCNWYAGNMNNSAPSEGVLGTPDRTIIPAGGTLNILGNVDRGFSYYGSNKGRGLDNYGTINWAAPILLRGNNGSILNNYGDVFVTHTTGNAQFYWYGNGAAPVWNNYGTLTRNTGIVPFYFNTAILNNSGAINVQSGLFSIYSSYATNFPGATIQVASGAALQNDNTSVTAIQPGSTLAGADYDSIRIPSGSVYLNSLNVASPSIWISGGVLYQQTNIVVSTINASGGGNLDLRLPCALANLNLTNGDLRGRDITVTNFNWIAGNQYTGSPTDGAVATPDRTIIPAGGTLNILGAADRGFSYYGSNTGRGLDNYGTINWSAPILLRGNNGAVVNNYGSVFVTHTTGNAQFYWFGNGTAPIWNNYGTFTRSTGSVPFYFNTAVLNNSGTMDIQSGTFSIYNTTATNLSGGVIQVASGATLANDNTSITYLLEGSVLGCASADAFQINSGNVYVRSFGLSMPSLWIAGGTLIQETNVVVPVINESAGTWRLNTPVSVGTYNLTNGELRGANLAVDYFNWLGGNLNSDGPASNLVTVASTLNIVGAAAKSMSYYAAPGRTLINNGSAIWGGGSITFSGQSSFQNNGSWTVTNDLALGWTGTGSAPPLFQNNGTFTKSAGAGVLTLGSTTFTNTGTVAINRGGLAVGGPFVQTAGSAFLGTNFSLSSFLRVEAGSLTGRGNVAGYFYNNGIVNSGASPGLITGTTFTNTAAATYNCELGGLVAGSGHDQIRLTGAAQVGGTLNVSLANNYAPVLSNQFIVVTTSARNGTFANVIPPPGVTINTIYSTTNVVLEITGLTNAPLQILTNPVSQTVWTPDPATFSVSVSGVTPISFQWQFNGTNIPSATNNVYSIASVATTNDGLYTVNITDGNGGTTNTSATLTVIPFAGTMYWTNVAGGEWSVPQNWIPNRVPGATNDAVISSNGIYTVYITSDAAVSNLFVGSLTATGTPTLYLVSGNSLSLGRNSFFETNSVFALNGLFRTMGGSNYIAGHVDWQLGTLSGAGRTVIETNASLTFVGSLNQKNIATNILENYGTFNYASDSFGHAQGLRFSGGAQLTNYASGTIGIGTAAYQYAGSQTPRSYLVNYGTIATASGNVFAPSYISIDFINYGTLQDNGYVYISRGANYGTFQWVNTLCEISVFGDESSGEYFSFEDGTAFLGAHPILRVGGYAQWNTTATHPGMVAIAAGSGGASFGNPEFRILKNYTQTGETVINKGRWSMLNSNLVADLNQMYDGIYNGFHTFTISNAGTIYVNSLTHSIRYLANDGHIYARSNLVLNGGATFGSGHIVISSGAAGTFTSGTVDGQFVENFGTTYANGNIGFTGDTLYRNAAGAATIFSGGFSIGPAGVLNEGFMDGYGGISGMNVTNRGTVYADDPLGRTLALATYRQESGSTECDPGSLSGAMDILGGTLSGDCALNGTLRNSATFSPGKPFGLFTISGNATNTASGLYNLPINGAVPTTNFPQVRVGGTNFFGGTLNVIFTNGFDPQPGNLFTVMVFTARSGVFDSIINDTYGLEAFYTPTTLVLRAQNLLPNAVISPVGGVTQLVCTPFRVNVTGSDPDGVVTNLVLKLNGATIASAPGSFLATTAEFDYPGYAPFIATATDDRGGARSVTQYVLMTSAPLHVLQLGGLRTNAFKLCMLGETGSNYMVLAATNLATPQASWTPLGLMENTNGIWRYFDAGTVTNRPWRFYRALQE